MFVARTLPLRNGENSIDHSRDVRVAVRDTASGKGEHLNVAFVFKDAKTCQGQCCITRGIINRSVLAYRGCRKFLIVEDTFHPIPVTMQHGKTAFE